MEIREEDKSLKEYVLCCPPYQFENQYGYISDERGNTSIFKMTPHIEGILDGNIKTSFFGIRENLHYYQVHYDGTKHFIV